MPYRKGAHLTSPTHELEAPPGRRRPGPEPLTAAPGAPDGVGPVPRTDAGHRHPGLVGRSRLGPLRPDRGQATRLCGAGRLVHLGTRRPHPARRGHQPEGAGQLHALVAQLPLVGGPGPRADPPGHELQRGDHEGPDQPAGTGHPGPAERARTPYRGGLGGHRGQRSGLRDHRPQLPGGQSVGGHPGGLELRLALHGRRGRPTGRPGAPGRRPGVLVARGDPRPGAPCPGVRGRVPRHHPGHRVRVLAPAPVLGP